MLKLPRTALQAPSSVEALGRPGPPWLPVPVIVMVLEHWTTFDVIGSTERSYH